MNVERAPEWLPTLLVPFFTLSYPATRPAEPDSFPTSHYYTTGLLDGCFIVTCIAVMALLRDFARIFLLEPFARWYLTRNRSIVPAKEAANGTAEKVANGFKNGQALPEGKCDVIRRTKKEERVIKRSVLRFAEQGWSMIYYSFQWSFGLYVHWNLPTAPFNLDEVWIGYPHIPLPAPLKIYYLTQTAFYMHQVLILNAEARRKDHYQMMTHHIITIVLMILSYFYNSTRVGCLIMVLMDYCDIFFPLAKMFRYLSLPMICDATFTYFLISWFITRHVLFVLVIKSAYIDAPRLLPLLWAPEQGQYLTKEVLLGFIALLVSLQFLHMIWFGMICRVAWRVISGQGAEDTRSDDEDDGNLPEDVVETTIPPNSALKKRRQLAN